MADTNDSTRKFGDEPDPLGQILTRIEDLSNEVTQLRESVEARHLETRPLAETLEAIRVDIRQLYDGQEELRRDTREGFTRVERKMDVLNKHLLETDTNVAGLDERILVVESREQRS